MYYNLAMNNKKSDSKSLFKIIRKIVSEIPEGKVSTYGQIARVAGTKDARKVGWAIHNNQDPKVPCHRVVKKDGSVAENFSLGGWEEQKNRLVKEGVRFVSEKQVDLKKHLWVPISSERISLQ